VWRLRTFVTQTVTIGEQKVCPESESLKFSQVENPSGSTALNGTHSSNQRHTGTLGFRRGKIFNSPEFLRRFEEIRVGEFCRAVVLFQKLAQKYQEVFPEFFKSCPNLPPLPTPIALTQKLCRNTSYLQLSGLNNWFHVVITIFAQHLNICSPKLGEWRRHVPPPGEASTNSYWCLCGFEPFVAISNP